MVRLPAAATCVCLPLVWSRLAEAEVAKFLGAVVREFIVAADHAATDCEFGTAAATQVVANRVRLLDHVDDIFAVFIVSHR